VVRHYGLMRRGRVLRWVAALGLIAVLASLPYAVGQLPAGGSAVTASSLLGRVQASAAIGYSGYAESTGSLALPVTTGEFSSVADLFGSTTQLRVWWRGAQDWRVDEVTASGEQDLHAKGSDLWSWDYESNTADLDRGAVASSAHLPRPDDLVPASLARRLLAEAQPNEVQRIASKRVAGDEAAGLRYVPSAPQSTISQVDVWALPGSGLPVEVAVSGRSGGPAIVSTTMLDLTTGLPAASTTAFTPPPGAKVVQEQAPDLLALADRLQSLPVPVDLGGLPRDSISPPSSAVTVYGSGVTVLVAIPIFGRTGNQIRDELTKAVGSAKTRDGITTSIGAINLLLSNPASTGLITGPGFTFRPRVSWLLVGTVTSPTLEQAGADIVAAGS
jgi:hypothetical protein